MPDHKIQVCRFWKIRQLFFFMSLEIHRPAGLSVGVIYNWVYGLYTAGVRATDWPTLKPSIVKPHQNALVLLLRSIGGWWWWAGGGGARRSRDLLSRKFHYPIGSDLPPSQLGLVLPVFPLFFLHWKSVFHFSSSLLCCALMAAAGISYDLAKEGVGGITPHLQMEEKRSDIDIPVWEWVRRRRRRRKRRGFGFHIQYKNSNHCKRFSMGSEGCLKTHQISSDTLQENKNDFTCSASAPRLNCVLDLM